MQIRQDTSIEFLRCALLAICFLASTHSAAISVETAPSLDGNFTVTWSSETGCVYHEPWSGWITFECRTLQERVGSDSWIPVSTPNGATSWTAIARDANTYSYRILYSYGDVDGGSSYVEEGPATVLVQSLNSITGASGFRGAYTAHVGDIDSNGHLDIYLQHRPAFVFSNVNGSLTAVPLDRAQVSEFIVQNSGAVLWINSNPTQQQIQTARQLPAASALNVVVDDINFDGADDIYIGNLGALIPGASDLLVFSSGIDDAPPTQLTFLNQPRRDFFEAVINWHDDPGYFDRTLTVGTRVPVAGAASEVPSFWLNCIAVYGSCERHYGLLTTYFGGWAQCFAAVWAQGINPYLACNLDGVHYLGILSQTMVVKDFSGYSQDVAQFVTATDGALDWSVEDAANVLHGVLGTVVGGIIKKLKYPGHEELTDPDDERRYEVMRVIRNVIRVLDSQFYRGSDEVYVTWRRAVFKDTVPIPGGGHLALEYRPKGSATVIHAPRFITAISARCGSITSYLNKMPDYAVEKNNRIIGVLTSPLYPEAADLWDALRQAESNYENCDLKYALTLPEALVGQRNSNGFVHGISDVVYGIESLTTLGYSFEDFYLGEYPVPPARFQP